MAGYREPAVVHWEEVPRTAKAPKTAAEEVFLPGRFQNEHGDIRRNSVPESFNLRNEAEVAVWGEAYLAVLRSGATGDAAASRADGMVIRLRMRWTAP